MTTQTKRVALAVDRPTEWLSPQQLAAELGVPVQSIYRWRCNGTGPRGHVVGRHVRYSRESINAWLEAVADDRPNGAA